jgi:hypothetical protein
MTISTTPIHYTCACGTQYFDDCITVTTDAEFNTEMGKLSQPFTMTKENGIPCGCYRRITLTHEPKSCDGVLILIKKI